MAEEKLKREERKEELNNVWKVPVETKLEEPLDDKAARALRKKMLNAKWEKALTTKDMNSCNN